MAFNPFHKFRKHQKVIFGALTIVCMLTFVLAGSMSGGGDFFYEIQRMLTGGVRKTTIFEIYGKDLSQRELVDLIRQREIADLYMKQATMVALQKREAELRPPNFDQMPPEQRERLNQAMGNDPIVQQLRSHLPNFFQPNRMYFGGSIKPDALVEFKIWLHQADLLGIRLSNADINAEFRRLTENKANQKDTGPIEAELRRRYRDYYTPELLMTALGNEFRVRMAQMAFFNPMLASATPQEFWEYYRDNMTKLDIRLLPVKAEDFIAQVKDQPTDKELRDLYEKYKNQEYAPEGKEPGFKQPRRIQLEWVSAKSDSEYYKKAAENFRPTVQAVQMIAAGFNGGAALTSIAPALQIGVPATQLDLVPAGRDTEGKDTTVAREYESMKYSAFKAPSYLKAWRTNFINLIHEKNLNQPVNVAAAVGEALTATSAPSAALIAVGTYSGSATLREIETRAKLGSDWVLSGAQPTPIMAAVLAAHMTPKEEYSPLPTVRSQVEERLVKALPMDLAVTALKAVQKEVESKSKGGDKEKKELAESLAKLVKEHRLEAGKTSEPRDQFKNKLDDDPGMKPLREAFLHPAPPGDPLGKTFSREFFTDGKLYTVERFPRSPFNLPLEEDSRWKTAPEAFVYWKTDDQPARTLPFDNAEVRKDVDRAWRLQKARELAKKEAEQLATKAKETKGDARKFKDFAKGLNKEPVELPALSKIMSGGPTAFPNAAAQYQFPRISEDKVPNAGQDFALKLLGLKEKGKGETLVLSDQPEATFYVAILVDKTEPSMDDFFRVYRDASSDSFRRDQLLQLFEQDRYRQYYMDVMAMLRDEAKLVVHKENLKSYEGTLGAMDD